jgi:hypothetical protein
MDAGHIFFLLVDSQGRIKLLHETRVIVTLAAESGYVSRSGSAQVAFPWILRRDLVILTRIAAMAIVA